MWNNRKSFIVGMQNAIATLEDSLVVLQDLHTLTISYSNHTPWYLLKGVENVSEEKPAHKSS